MKKRNPSPLKLHALMQFLQETYIDPILESPLGGDYDDHAYFKPKLELSRGFASVTVDVIVIYWASFNDLKTDSFFVPWTELGIKPSQTIITGIPINKYGEVAPYIETITWHFQDRRN